MANAIFVEWEWESWLDFGQRFRVTCLHVLLKNISATFARPIAGVSCPQAERRPQPAVAIHRYGATWPMECMSSAATKAAAASVSTAPVAAERAAPRLCWGRDLNDLHFYDRQAQGGWNLVKLEVSLEEFLGFCLGGSMWSDMIWRNLIGCCGDMDNVFLATIFVLSFFSFPCLETHLGMRTRLQRMCQHGQSQILVTAERVSLDFGAGLLAFYGLQGLFRIHLGQRNSFWSLCMKVAVANASEMTCSYPNQLISALLVSKSFAPVIFLQCHFFEALALLKTQRWFGDVWVADFQHISMALREDLFARFPLRLRPANMNFVSLPSLDAF